MERFVKKIFAIGVLPVFLLSGFAGCTSIAIPHYIQDKNPYTRIYYGKFDEVREAVIRVLEESGWVIEKESEPALFERERDFNRGNKQTLVFTKVRERSFFVGSRYARINTYIYEVANNEMGIEVRYAKVTSLLFKNFYGYKNDRAVERIFTMVEERVQPSALR